MKRPNLARESFVDIRPVVLVCVALFVLAALLTAYSLHGVFRAKDKEQETMQRIAQLEGEQASLAKEVDAQNRTLAAVKWKKLAAETTSMQGVVAGRRLSWSRLLADLERVLPWDTRLITISPQIREDGGVEITLTGVAANREAWLKLISTLFTDKSFSDPVPFNEEAPGTTNVVGYRFQLRTMYRQEVQP